MRLGFSLLLCSAMLLVGCGRGSSNNSNPPVNGTGALSGNWQMSLLPTGKTLAKTQSGFLQQSGSTVTGGLMVLDSPCSGVGNVTGTLDGSTVSRSEEHTSELQSRRDLVCRLLLEKKKKKQQHPRCQKKNEKKTTK